MKQRTLYGVLGLTGNATSSEIRTAYRLLAMKSHPAHQKGLEASERFVQVSGAFATLSDAEKKRQYDARLAGGTEVDLGLFDQITPVQAERMFAREMSTLAWELSDAGYDGAFIQKALSEEGCPVALAVAAARATGIESGDSRETERIERIPNSTENAARGTRGGASRSRWVLAGAALFACLLVYSLAYRPYVAAKEAEAKRIVAEKELAAAMASKAAAEAMERAAAQKREEERVRRDEAMAAQALAEQRERSKEEARRQAEYQACLARLAPAPPVRTVDSGGAGGGAAAPARPRSGGELMGAWAGAMTAYRGAQYEESNRRANAEVRIRGEAVCLELLRR